MCVWQSRLVGGARGTHAHVICRAQLWAPVRVPAFLRCGPTRAACELLIVAPGSFRSVRGPSSLPANTGMGEKEWARKGKRLGMGSRWREAGLTIDRDGGGEMTKRERAADGWRVGKADTPKYPCPLSLHPLLAALRPFWSRRW